MLDNWVRFPYWIHHERQGQFIYYSFQLHRQRRSNKGAN
ncbi:MAG: hypothetical protein ACI9UJ_001837 [bacterium]|jgi:hypothetical protein